MRKLKNERGITLVALVVTIIVLIILAGVSINLVLGENGIITKAKEASKKQEIANVKEEIQLKIMAKQAENKGDMTEEELKTILETKGTLSEEENILDKTLITENGYEIKVSDIYDEELGEVVVDGITATDIEADASYIGKYVNYGGTASFKGVGWRIFNVENGQIQLIADNYIKSDVIPKATNIRIGKAEYSSMQSDYCVNSSDNRITLLNYINTTSNWNHFVAVTGATVTGGPTLQQFVNSYNRTHGPTSQETVKKIFIAEGEVMSDGLKGYYVGKSENPNSFDLMGLNRSEMDNLYLISNDTNAKAYWIGSPATGCTEPIYQVFGGWTIDNKGHLNCSGARDSNYDGLRPLVSLPSGIILVEQENGTYNIQ